MYKNYFFNSARLAWSNKHLWLLGIMAGFLMVGGNYQTIANIMTGNYEQYLPGFYVDFFQQVLHLRFMIEMISNNSGQLAILLISFLAIIITFAVLIWLGVVSRGAIILASYQKSKKQEFNFNSNIFNFKLTGSDFVLGRKYAWPILGFFLFSKIVLLSSAMFIAFLISKNFEILRFSPVFILLFLIIIFSETIFNLAAVFAVGQRNNFWRAINLAIVFFCKNFKISTFAFLVNFLVEFILGFLTLFFVNYILSTPVNLLALVLRNVLDVVFIWKIYTIVALSISAFVSAFIVVFQAGIWSGIVAKNQ